MTKPVDFTKPVYWNGNLIKQNGDGHGSAVKRYVFVEEGPEFEIKNKSSRSHKDSYTYLYIDTDPKSPNYGWSAYEPLPLTNSPSDLVQQLKETIAGLRNDGYEVSCTLTKTEKTVTEL